MAADDVVKSCRIYRRKSVALGIDADASSVSVEITDGVDTVTVDASYARAAGWSLIRT